jgi:uracil-DNA glycosylase
LNAQGLRSEVPPKKCPGKVPTGGLHDGSPPASRRTRPPRTLAFGSGEREINLRKLAGYAGKDRDPLQLGITREQFYDPRQIALVPTGFCYPGSGASGDFPPRPECAPLWHPRILPLLKRLNITIYLGSFAFESNLGAHYRNLSEAAEDFRMLLPGSIVLPHPSPRNGMWASQRPWFQADLLPALRARVKEALET